MRVFREPGSCLENGYALEDRKVCRVRSARNVDYEDPSVVTLCLVALIIERLRSRFGWRPEAVQLFLCCLP
jgi:hypothetical protein